MATLDTLLTEKTAADYQTEILADLADPAVVGGSGLPTTSWQSGSTPRTLIAAFSQISEDFGAAQRAVAEGGFLDLATGEWLTLLAEQRFTITRDIAVATIGNATLTSAGGGPYVIAAGSLLATDSTGITFRNYTGGTLAASGTLMLRWQALETGSDGNISNNSLTTLSTALATVTINNPATWIDLPGTVGSKTTGLVTLTDGAATGPHVIGAGTVTVGNGAGLNFVTTASVTIPAAGSASVAVEAAANGLNYNLANGTLTTVVVTPVAGITSTNPGTTWITTSGADEQSDASLRQECRDKWATLGVGWTSAALSYLAKQAATSTPMTRVRVTTNPGGVAGLVGITLGSVAGVVSAGDVTIVQAYFAADRTTLTSSLSIASCVAQTVALTGTIRVRAAYASTAQADAQRNIRALEESLPIGGDDDVGNVLEREDIIACIKNAIYDSDGNNVNPASPIKINLTAPAADVAYTASNRVIDIDYSALVWEVV